MSPKKIREQSLPNGANNTYVRVLVDGELTGNVFGTAWIYDGRQIIWITQLCVSQKYRNRGIAKLLVENLGQNERAVGILSAHPFAILAVLRVFGRGLTHDEVKLEMARENAQGIMKSCPVEYVQKATLRGILFEEEVKDGTVSCANTQFWVDHEEPFDALRTIREKGVVWPFGKLPDGHEFVDLMKAKADPKGLST